MVKVIGVVFILLGIIVHIFFTQNYGSLIPYQLLMHLLGIALIPAGIFLIFFDARKKSGKKVNNSAESWYYLKESGDKIIINLEDCDFKSNDYAVEMPDLQTQYDAFEGPEHRTHIENILQSMVIYTCKTGSHTESFLSPVYPIDIVSLKTHIMNHELILHVDPEDRSKYFFELNDPNLETV
jgi:hypothetical protein